MRILLTWSDRGAGGPRPAHHGERSKQDRGPILRLLEQPESQSAYKLVVVLCSKQGLGPAVDLLEDIRQLGAETLVRQLDIEDPSDFQQIFREVLPALAGLPEGSEIDVLLSAGTPQAQAIWVILVQAGLLKARMLQIIPAAFVPHPHPRAIREVSLDIEGFPEIRALREEVVRLRAQTQLSGGRLVGNSPVMLELARLVARLARSDVPVLVQGETGTGKELVARALHQASPRAQGPFVAENCAAFDEGVLASELFGHEKGAFTGAAARRRGLFEMAHGGTLFLDEIGELPARVQAHLLRVLQEGELRRVGGEVSVRVDVRVVCATHRDLASLVREGRFREDLYYRLRGATVRVPALRERREDLELLVAHFLAETQVPRLRPTQTAWRALTAYRWPGNVRELRAEVLRWTIFCDDLVRPEDLSPEILGLQSVAPASTARPLSALSSGPPDQAVSATGTVGLAVAAAGTLDPLVESTGAAGQDGKAAGTLEQVVEAAEEAAIVQALAAQAGNLSRTAAALDIDRNTLKRKLARYGIRRET